MIIDPLVMSGEYQSDDVHTIKFIVAFSNVINYVPGSKFNLGYMKLTGLSPFVITMVILEIH